MIDFDELRKNVAIKHNVLLDHDDPMLVTVTLNDLVLRHYAKILSGAMKDHVEQSKEIAEGILSETADYISDQVLQAVEKALNEARNDVAEVRRANLEASTEVQNIKAASSTAMAASVIAALCASFALAAVVVVIIKIQPFAL